MILMTQALKCAPFGPVFLGISRPLNTVKQDKSETVVVAKILSSEDDEKISDANNDVSGNALVPSAAASDNDNDSARQTRVKASKPLRHRGSL